MNDKKLMKWILFILLLPLTLAYFSGDRFRYPCQDPNNWDKQMCKLPYCDVTRTCPEHIFKGQNDPRVGPDGDKPLTSKQASTPVTGANCK
jgi:hypothetical protein